MIANARPLSALKPRKAKAPKPQFDRDRALVFARDALSRPPADPYAERVPMTGELVCEFVLPLGLCKPQNRKGKGRGERFAHMGTIRKLHKKMGDDLPVILPNWQMRFPLKGRPQVRCIRFSSVQPDNFADWGKLAIDRLCVHVPRLVKGKPDRNTKLGIIQGDKPREADVSQKWEPAPAGKGFVYIAVSTGEPVVPLGEIEREFRKAGGT